MIYQSRMVLGSLLLSAGLLFGCMSSDTHGSATSSKATTPKKASAPLALLPPDDGYACAILYGSDIYGSLDDCGCPKHPEGGLVWRMGYTDAFAKHSPGVPILQVDAGYYFADRRDPDGLLYPFDEIGNEWVLKAYSKLNFDAANLSYHDIPYGERLFEKTRYQDEKAAMPFLARLTSANLRARRPGTVPPSPYVIREVRGDRLGERSSLRVGFIGLTEAGTVEDPASVFEIEDALGAARRLAPRVRSQCDVLVVLAYLKPEQARRLAREVPGIDLIITANDIHQPRDPDRVGRTIIASTRRQTRSLGEALIYLDDGGHVHDIRVRLIEMDDVVPPDLAAQDLVDKATFDIQWEKQKYFRKRGQKTSARKRQSLTQAPWQ